MDNEQTETEDVALSAKDAQEARMDEFFGDTAVVPEPTKDEPIEQDPSANEPDDDFYAKADALDDPDVAKKEEEKPPAEAAEEKPKEELAKEEPIEEPKETPVKEEGEPTEKAKIDENDPFDAETMQKLREMATDPHAGIKYAELRQELKNYKQQIANYEEQGVNTPEMQEMKVRAERVSELEVALKDAQEKISMYDYQSTPDYQQVIQAPFQAIMNDAKAIEGAREIPEGAVMNAISAANPEQQEAAIQELMQNYQVTRRDEMKMYQMADAAVALRAKEQSLQSTAQERMQGFKEQQEAQSAYQREQETSLYRKTLRDTFQQYEGSVNAFLDAEGKNKPEWNDALKQSENLDFRDVELQAISAYALTAAPVLAKENKQLASEVAKLNVLLKRHQAATPPAPNSTQSQTPAAKPSANADAGLSLSDSLGRRLAAAGIT